MVPALIYQSTNLFLSINLCISFYLLVHYLFSFLDFSEQNELLLLFELWRAYSHQKRDSVLRETATMFDSYTSKMFPSAASVQSPEITTNAEENKENYPASLFAVLRWVIMMGYPQEASSRGITANSSKPPLPPRVVRITTSASSSALNFCRPRSLLACIANFVQRSASGSTTFLFTLEMAILCPILLLKEFQTQNSRSIWTFDDIEVLLGHMLTLF